jgi:SAM-dependent methyltransferase
MPVTASRRTSRSPTSNAGAAARAGASTSSCGCWACAGRRGSSTRGAGQGWYSLPLARRHEVLGIDTSERLIAEARGRAAHLPTGRAPRLIVAPSQAVPVPDGAFDLALSLSGSIGYGSRDDDRATLAELRRVLAPDGRLVLEVPQGEAVARGSDYVEAFACGDLVVHEPRVDQRLQLLRETQTLLRRSAEPQPFAYAMQLYDVSELEALLDEAGLSPIGRFGGTDGSRLSASSGVCSSSGALRPRPPRRSGPGSRDASRFPRRAGRRACRRARAAGAGGAGATCTQTGVAPVDQDRTGALARASATRPRREAEPRRSDSR